MGNVGSIPFGVRPTLGTKSKNISAPAAFILTVLPKTFFFDLEVTEKRLLLSDSDGLTPTLIITIIILHIEVLDYLKHFLQSNSSAAAGNIWMCRLHVDRLLLSLT